MLDAYLWFYLHCVNYGWKQAKVCDTLSSMHVCPYVHGKVMNIDVGLINHHAFTYVASYGKFMEIPYETPQELKKRLERLVKC